MLPAEDGKFNCLDGDDTYDREKAAQNKISYLYKKHGAFKKVSYDRIFKCSSKIRIMYGLQKIYKKQTPIRPIISAIVTNSHELS